MIETNRYLEENEHAVKQKLLHINTGRDKELETVKIQFDTVLQGHLAWTVIAGDIGIGKTALVKAALADLSKLNATCVYGKFEQYKNEEPYILIIQIIEKITNHMLTLPSKKLDRIKEKLINQMGKDVTLLEEIVPLIAKITGKHNSPKVIDYQKLKIRLEAAFQKFFAVAKTELYPLVIAVDDLQWMEKPSWDIIKAITDPLSESDIYIILVYRNNLDEYRTRIKSMLAELPGNEYILEINLESLSYQDIKVMLEDVFDNNIDKGYKLARLIHSKTMGNPMHVKQMINLLLDNKGIFYDSQKGIWGFESEDIRSLNLSSSIEDIINRKIKNLNHQQKRFMEILACMGSRFTVDLLEKVIKDKNSLEDDLLAACRAGLLVENIEHVGDACKREYEFFHDRIHQNVYEQIDSARREQLHFEIATKLLKDPDRNYVADNIISITAHLLNCKNAIKKEGIGDRLLDDLFYAGVKAKQAAAVEHALKLFSLSEELLGDTCWQKDYHRTLKIKLELAQCQYICGEYEASREHFEEMLAHAAGKDDLEIKKQYMIMYSYAGDHAMAIDLGIQALKQVGVKIYRRNLKMQIVKEIFYGKLLFRDNRLNAIKHAPVVTEQRIVHAFEISIIIAPAAMFIDENLFALNTLKTANLSAKYGNSRYAPIAYAAYSLMLSNILGDYHKAEKLKDIALSLLELFDDDNCDCTVYFLIGTFVAHWTSPAQESLNYLQKAFDCALKAGDYLYCGYAIGTMMKMKYSMGGPLVELDKFLELHKKYGKKMDHDLLLRSIKIIKEHINILTLSDEVAGDGLVGEQEVEQMGTNEMMIYYLLKSQRLYLDGKIEEAYDLLQKSIKQLDTIMGYIIQVDFVFYYLLVSLETMKCLKGGTNKQTKIACRKFRKKLKNWAKLSPENHWGKHLLVEALYLSLSNRKHDAAGMFDEAIEHARENHNLHLEALGNYLAAGYYSSNRKVAEVYAQDACRLFNEWGAVRTANRIEMLYGLSAASRESAVGEVPENNGPEMNVSEETLKVHQKELEVLELEASFKYFLDLVCREAKADFGAILLEDEDEIKLEYERREGQAAVKYPVGIDPEQVEHLPKKVIRFANRTYEEVIIEAKPADGPFATDDHIRSRTGISIICLPLKYNQIFAGLIYIESQYNHRFNPMLVEYIQRLSFYLIAKQALEKEPLLNSKAFITEMVNDQLTEREIEVLNYMAEGLSNTEISKKMQISSGTVKTHILHFYRKLEVNNRVQAVNKGRALKLIK